MDDTTDQFDDDVDARLEEPTKTTTGIVQGEGNDAEMTEAQQGNENLETTQEQVVKDAHVTIFTVLKKTKRTMFRRLRISAGHKNRQGNIGDNKDDQGDETASSMTGQETYRPPPLTTDGILQTTQEGTTQKLGDDSSSFTTTDKS
ncbi:hypothetical protein Tco_0498686 [Tanacetum coccineum]